VSARDAHWLEAVNEHLAAVLAPVPEDVAAVLSPDDVADLRARTRDVLFQRAIAAMLTLPDDESESEAA
jgi:hypothetical protein